jgi:uncharacterized membrane protein YcjF (UPF0283 family)
MWGKLIFNTLGVLLGVGLAIVFLYTWWRDGYVQADWFVWLMFALGLFNCVVQCLADGAKALANILQERRVKEQIERDIAVRDWLERRR